MLKLVICALCIAYVLCATLNPIELSPVLDDDIIHAVNSANATWHAARNSRFASVSIAAAKKMMGAKKPQKYHIPTSYQVVESIPESWDFRTAWPVGCVGAVRDQGQCGSCWSFGATESLADRFCANSGGQYQMVLSPEDLISCDSWDHGCNGGELQTAWTFMQDYGVVLESCVPYVGYAENCGSACPTGQPWQPYFVQAGSIQRFGSIAAMQSAIAANGPIEAAFTVYQDFMSYDSGVYQHTSGGMLGGHAIEVVGWGSLNGVPYWECKNSWGPAWGESGFFKILMGSNECGIEEDMTAGMPRL